MNGLGICHLAKDLRFVSVANAKSHESEGPNSTVANLVAHRKAGTMQWFAVGDAALCNSVVRVSCYNTLHYRRVYTQIIAEKMCPNMARRGFW